MNTKDVTKPFESCSPDSWLIREEGWDSNLRQVRETHFTLGNGYLCSRGILEEMTTGTVPGTFIAGIYDRTGAQITEIVNLPNPFHFRLDVYGEKLDPSAMDVISHSRGLDMYRGTLYRHTLYETTRNKRLDYRSRRFVSLANKHIAVMEITVTPLDADMTVNAQTIVDIGVSNHGAITEGRKRHFQPVEVIKQDKLTYLCVETFEKQELVAYATALEICRKKSCKLVADRAVNLRVRKNEAVSFRKYIAITSSRHVARRAIKRTTITILKAARRHGFDRLIAEHEKSWEARWDVADVEFEGDPKTTQALRFNMYHLIIAGSEEDDDVSIGARTLSGEGYRGHIFWDTELFILPFFIYTNPVVAKNLLSYRYHRLDAARHNAAANEYKGSLFPWESADTGEECTPSWAKNYDGSIVKIVTMDQEHHIVADIVYGLLHYCEATGDSRFAWTRALEPLIESARFWCSRVHYNASRKRYEIHHVMGPDEFHENVNNNAYTNMMAQWNLRAAVTWCRRARREKPMMFARLATRVKLTQREIATWLKVAQQMFLPVSRKRKLIKPFEGYFHLKDYPVAERNSHGMPEVPASLDWRTVGETQLIKQADMVMLLYLLGGQFSLREKRRNYYYNERRTLHKSSLSPSIHAVVGLEVGDKDKALHYFSHALSTDLADIHGNTDLGFHAASGGGTWQAAIMGFAGMRPKRGVLSFNPHLPQHWKRVRFSVWWRGALLRVAIDRQKTEIRCERRSRLRDVLAEAYGVTKILKPNTTMVFPAPKQGPKGRLDGSGGLEAVVQTPRPTRL